VKIIDNYLGVAHLCCEGVGGIFLGELYHWKNAGDARYYHRLVSMIACDRLHSLVSSTGI